MWTGLVLDVLCPTSQLGQLASRSSRASCVGCGFFCLSRQGDTHPRGRIRDAAAVFLGSQSWPLSLSVRSEMTALSRLEQRVSFFVCLFGFLPHTPHLAGCVGFKLPSSCFESRPDGLRLSWSPSRESELDSGPSALWWSVEGCDVKRLKWREEETRTGEALASSCFVACRKGWGCLPFL